MFINLKRDQSWNLLIGKIIKESKKMFTNSKERVVRKHKIKCLKSNV
jgi:hypothetical protein